MLYLIYLLILASIVLLTISIYPQFLRRPLPVFREDSAVSRQIKRPALFKFMALLMPINKVIVDKLGRKNLENRILAASVNLLPEDFITLKQGLVVLSVLLVLFFKPLFLGRQLIWLIVFIAASFLLPDMWLKMRLGKRQKMVIRALPDAIDLLSLCVNAGLDFSLAVKWVVDKSKPSPLIEELELLLLETKVGKSRKQALQDMARRISLPEVHSFSRALIQAERLGTPVESALTILSEEMRDYRFRAGERLALQAPIKLLFPLIFFIMPVVGIIVGGPVLLQFMQGGIPGFK
jgi:tight adherence protein C